MASSERNLALQNRSLENFDRSFDRTFSNLRGAINNIFDDWFEGMLPGERMLPSLRLLNRPSDLYAPRIDVAETDNEVVVTSELPGLMEKDIDVAVTEDTLTIKGEKKEDKEEKKKDYYSQERYFGAFERRIGLPCEVKVDKVNAVFKNGILTITLPKSPEAQQHMRHIAVKTS